MTVYLSTSCFGRTSVSEAIAACQKVAGNFVEISAPHDYQSMDDLKEVLKGFRDKGVNFALHNYFPAPKSPFVLNMAASDSITYNKTEELIKNAFCLADYAESPFVEFSRLFSEGKSRRRWIFYFFRRRRKL